MKVGILGDSISEGIGSKKINYARLLQQKDKNIIIENFAKSGTTLKYFYEIESYINKFNPDVLIMFYGHVDAMPRPNSKSRIYKMIPSRYKGNGMSNPRALYTSKKPKRYFQMLDSIFRIYLNKFLIKFTGYEQWNDIISFQSQYEEIIKKNKDKKIIMLSTVPIYDEWFPYAVQEFSKYDEIIKNLSIENQCEFINTMELFSKYDKNDYFLSDYFHLNEFGYEVITNKILDLLKISN